MGVYGTVIDLDGALPTIHPTAFVAPGATIVGDVTIGAQASIWYACVLRGDVNRIEIGARCSVQDGTIIHVSPGDWPVVVGDDVLVGHGALLHGCRVDHGALIGMRATALNGCVVESGAVLAAGALLTEGQLVPADEVWAGVPARRIGTTDPGRGALTIEQAKHYVAIAGRHDQAIGGLGLTEEGRG